MKKKHPVHDALWGISIKEIARRARVDESTARRWKRGDIIPSPGILLVLSGDLGAFDPAWEGWFLQKGLLRSPEDWACSPGDVRAIQLKDAQIRAYREAKERLQYELDVLQKKAPWLDEQPAPEEFVSSQLKMTKV